MSNRKDNKGRVLHRGEGQRPEVVTRSNTPIGWEKPALSIRGL